MESNGGDSSEIVRELKELKLQKAELEHRISSLEAKLHETVARERCIAVSNGCSLPTAPATSEHGLDHGLSPDQIYRYSRQLLLPSFGVEVIGAGGLGSPALLYLAACGRVPGVIGCLQALETIKLASLVGEPLSERMLLFDALSARIRIVKIRGRSAQCTVCGDNSSFNKQQFKDFDYEDFTQFPLSAGPLNLLPPESRINSKEFKEILEKKEQHVLLDVRPAHHYKIVSLPDSLNIPLANLEARLDELTSALKEKQEANANPSLYVVCRRGNDSQRAVQYLRDWGFDSAKDITGGLEAWAADVNPNFPTY
ncbi:unnamed protein product [Eruca vesicaria subsp. sativa]|uniref:Rhodanese domain-containing protein n=1 Tax=Eruca vesicaria subsp. sativa TaxID=29727 RepID=A0ABC8LZ19_ERUVS|nr:unnamed protein product [Eruca vesicaria subsp. sativa]